MTWSGAARLHPVELGGVPALSIVGAMIAGLFAGSTVVTPLYVIYQKQFDFSQITLTLIYAVYVVGNLTALLFFGRLSDKFGRRRIAIPAIGTTMVAALIFLFAGSTVSLYVGRVLSGIGIGVGVGTGTAWVTELVAGNDKLHATVIATAANYAGLGLGSLVSGLLAQFAPWPLGLPFVVYITSLAAIAVLVLLTQETVSHPVEDVAQASLRPRLSVPRQIRAQFVAPAVTGFGALALTGFYAALVPSILVQNLHETSHAVAGALVFEMAVVACAGIVVFRGLGSRAAMLWSLAMMPASVVLVVSAQLLASMLLMVAATAACGATAGLGYRGSLQVVNEISPDDRRAEVMSSYFLCGFCGNALPVVGIGVLSTGANSTVASVTFAAVLIVFAMAAFFFGIKYIRVDQKG